MFQDTFVPGKGGGGGWIWINTTPVPLANLHIYPIANLMLCEAQSYVGETYFIGIWNCTTHKEAKS